MDNISLDFIEDIKDLGLIINKKLNWNPHIDLKLAKSNKTFNFLRRNVPFQVEQQRTILLYRSLILSVLLFISTAWSPSKNSLRRFENFQKRVLKWVSNSNDYDKCLQMLNMLPIFFELIRTDVILLWKIWHKKVKITVELELIKSINSNRSAITNPFAFKDTRQQSDNSFFIRAVRTANEFIKLKILIFEPTLPIFSRDLKNYLVQNDLLLT